MWLLLPLAMLAPFGPVTGGTPVAADDSSEIRLTVRGSGLPVPRFVTLKSDDVNMRAGPGTEYTVLWHYRKEGLPLRVEAEFGVWRKVVDHDGATGWMHHSVVSLKRCLLYTSPSPRD